MSHGNESFAELGINLAQDYHCAYTSFITAKEENQR